MSKWGIIDYCQHYLSLRTNASLFSMSEPELSQNSSDDSSHVSLSTASTDQHASTTSTSDDTSSGDALTTSDSKKSKSWTTPEQKAFLEAQVPAFLKAQSGGQLPYFWPTLDRDWFAQWSERERLYPGVPGEPAPPLSSIALEHIQEAIASRKNVCFHFIR